MRRRRLWKIALIIFLLALALLVYAAWPGHSTFTISQETTYITSPLDKDGYPDYVTALNERLRGDITPETNANVLIWQVLGPRPEGANMPPEYFQWLGVPEPPEQGEYWVMWDKHLEERLKKEFRERLPELNDRRDRAAKWPWQKKDEPELADWLARNEKPLAIVLEATRRTEYYNPLAPKKSADRWDLLIGSMLPNVQRCRELAAALACRAMLRVKEGKFDEAWRDLLACHKLGRLVGRGGSLIELLVGVALDRTASTAEIAFLGHANLPPDRISDCLRDLKALPPMPGVGDKINKYERFMCLDAFMSIARNLQNIEDLNRPGGGASKAGNPLRRLFTRSVNWDPALRNANRAYDRCAALTRLTDRDQRAAEMKLIQQDFVHQTSIGFVENQLLGPKARGESIGKLLMGLTLASFDKVQNVEDRCGQIQGNLLLAFALALFHADHGRYPAKLDELVPKYFERIPDDVFSGKPLIYRLEGAGYLLYGVGQDGKDDNGHGYDDEPRGDDIAVRMPVPEPKIKK